MTLVFSHAINSKFPRFFLIKKFTFNVNIFFLNFKIRLKATLFKKGMNSNFPPKLLSKYFETSNHRRGYAYNQQFLKYLFAKQILAGNLSSGLSWKKSSLTLSLQIHYCGHVNHTPVKHHDEATTP